MKSENSINKWTWTELTTIDHFFIVQNLTTVFNFLTYFVRKTATFSTFLFLTFLLQFLFRHYPHRPLFHLGNQPSNQEMRSGLAPTLTAVLWWSRWWKIRYLYIIGRFCLFVTKNEHFAKLSQINFYFYFQVGFHGFSWFQVGLSWFQVCFHGFSWYQVGFSWFSPKIYPPELYPGPTIQSRSAARRAA